MKKIIILLSLLTLSGCSPDATISIDNSIKSELLEYNINSKTATPCTIAEKNAKKINLPDESTILYFDNKQVIYYIDEWTSNGQYLDLSLYKYKFADDSHMDIEKFSNFLSIVGDVSFSSEKLYIPCSFYGEKNAILELNLSTNVISPIKEWSANVLLCNTYVENSVLYIFEIILEDPSAHYKVTSVNLTDFSETEVYNKTYKDGNGYNVSCVTLDENYMYLYTIEWDNNKHNKYILKYDLKDKAFSKLKLSENTNKILDNEAVLAMFARNGYLILNTSNSQTYIEQIDNTEILKSTKIPSELNSNIHSRYIGIAAPNYNSDYLLLATTTNEETTLYQFDSSKKIFTPIIIDFNKENLNTYYLDKDSNLIMKSEEVTSSNVDFFLINLDNVLQNV